MMKRFPEVIKKNEDDFEDSYTSLDVASTTECTGMIPSAPLTEAQAENYGDIFSIPQQTAYNAKKSDSTAQQEKRSSVKR